MVTQIDRLTDKFNAWWVANGGPAHRTVRGFGDNMLVFAEFFTDRDHYAEIAGMDINERAAYRKVWYSTEMAKIDAFLNGLGVKYEHRGSTYLIKRDQWGK